LVSKIAALVVIQLAVFGLFLWWFSHRGHHGNSGVTTKPAVIEARPGAK
jgi:hypothetical protein